MTTNQHFPLLIPSTARQQFLIRDESWETRFMPGFDRFIIASLEYARPVIKLPMLPGRTGNHAFFFVRTGEIQARVGHWAGTLTHNSMVIVPATQIFSLESIRDDTIGFMCFVSPEFLATAAGTVRYDFLKLTNTPLIPLAETQVSSINHLFSRLADEYFAHGTTKTDLLYPYLQTLLAELNRAYTGTAFLNQNPANWLVQRFMDLLTTHARQSRSVGQYADWLNVSANHLNKVIRTQTGQSPSVWLAGQVVLEAKVMLFQSDLTVAQIASELGFADQTNFGKVFRRHTGSSPTAFRKMINSD